MRNSECWYINICHDTCDKCLTFLQMNWQMEHSGLPKAKQRVISLDLNKNNLCDKDAFHRLADIKKNIVEFVAEGKNLFICSNYTGNGKTSWAIKLLHSYFHHTAAGNYDNLKGMFVSTTELLLKLKDFNNPVSQKYINQLKEVDLVIWDDVAISGISAYDLTQLYSIIDHRVLAEKANVFTSNQTDVETLTDLIGSRLASRIYYTSEIIELKGKDMR